MYDVNLPYDVWRLCCIKPKRFYQRTSVIFCSWCKSACTWQSKWTGRWRPRKQNCISFCRGYIKPARRWKSCQCNAVHGLYKGNRCKWRYGWPCKMGYEHNACFLWRQHRYSPNYNLIYVKKPVKLSSCCNGWLYRCDRRKPCKQKLDKGNNWTQRKQGLFGYKYFKRNNNKIRCDRWFSWCQLRQKQQELAWYEHNLWKNSFSNTSTKWSANRWRWKCSNSKSVRLEIHVWWWQFYISQICRWFPTKRLRRKQHTWNSKSSKMWRWNSVPYQNHWYHVGLWIFKSNGIR